MIVGGGRTPPSGHIRERWETAGSGVRPGGVRKLTNGGEGTKIDRI